MLIPLQNTKSRNYPTHDEHTKLLIPHDLERTRRVDGEAETPDQCTGNHLTGRVLPYVGWIPGRPLEDRTVIVRTFVTKMVYNMATTHILLDRLESDSTVRRRLCGWERKEDVPSKSTFLRAYAEFTESRLPEWVR